MDLAEDYTPYVTGSAQPKLTMEALGAVQVSGPTTAREQRLVGKHVNRIDESFDMRLKAARRSITLLREYRQALITAAVTGQLEIPTPGMRDGRREE